MQRLKIGYTRLSFAEERNFLNLPFENIYFKKCFDLYSYKRRIMQKKNISDLNIQNTHKPLPFFDNVNLYHFFNTISYTKKPYVVTFETSLPRWEKNIHKGLELMQKDNLLALVAISNNAKKIQTDFLLSNYPQNSSLLNKLSVISPAQNSLISIEDIEQKYLNLNHIEFVIAGHLFFLKGGLEILRAFDCLLTKKHPIKLTIISKLQTDKEYTNTGEEDINIAHKIINKHKKSIIWHKSLANQEVIDVLKKSHIALLPSYADTYGYFALEAQACACPVISTNIRALPEINSADRGWIIETPINDLGYAEINSTKKLKKTSEIIEEELIRIIEDVLDKKDVLKNKADNALHYIIKNHNPVDKAQQYLQIYQKAFNV
jgi:glycosyltransferase involved in cell wall biosynthesis